MSNLQIIYGYQDIFRKISEPITIFDESTEKLATDLLDSLYFERAVGIAAPMVGISKRIIAVDLFENQVKNPIVAINPKILHKSKETQTFEEQSLCFPDIVVNVERSKMIEISYQNPLGETLELKAEGFLSTVIQHEMDYLDGITIFDKVSKLKRDTLLKKLHKNLKLNPPHVHSSSCRH